jgi:hypothetical protein
MFGIFTTIAFGIVQVIVRVGCGPVVAIALTLTYDALEFGASANPGQTPAGRAGPFFASAMPRVLPVSAFPVPVTVTLEFGRFVSVAVPLQVLVHVDTVCAMMNGALGVGPALGAAGGAIAESS